VILLNFELNFAFGSGSNRGSGLNLDTTTHVSHVVLPHPTSSSCHLLLGLFPCPVVIWVRGGCRRGVVDVAGVDVAASTCAGRN